MWFPFSSTELAMIANSPRKPIQKRRIEYASFMREDGLFEIEGSLIDSIAPADESIHVMKLRVVFDGALVIQMAEATIETGPFETCADPHAMFQRLVGEQISPGWKQRVRKKIGRTEGCTHQLELLFSMATVAYQAVTMSPQVNGLDPFAYLRDKGERPYFLGGCRAWRTDGEMAGKHFPEFAGPERG